MTVTRVAATVVFLGLQFLPTFTSCARPPYRTTLLAPLTWALALTFSFTAMWECEFDTLSLNLLFGGAAGVCMGGQFGSEWRRRRRDWLTRLVGSVLLLLYVVLGSLKGNGRLVKNYGPNICEVASKRTPLEEFAAPLQAYAKVGALAMLLVLASVSGRLLLPWRWCSRRSEERLAATEERGAGGAPPSSPPPQDAALSFFESPTAIAAMVFRCLMTGGLGATLYGWKLHVDLDDPRNVAFAFATVRTRDWAVLMFAAVVEVVTSSLGVVAYAHYADETISWDDYKRDHLPLWTCAGCARFLSCCPGRWSRAENNPEALARNRGDEEAPASVWNVNTRETTANASSSYPVKAERLDNPLAYVPSGVHLDVNSRTAGPASPIPQLYPTVYPT